MFIICSFLFVIAWVLSHTVRSLTGKIPFIIALVVVLITVFGMITT